MALQLTYENTDTGASYAGAYHRITRVEINRLASGVELTVAVYKDATARDVDKSALNTSTVGITGSDYVTYFSDVALDNGNPTKQGYAYLKALAAYAGAVDV